MNFKDEEGQNRDNDFYKTSKFDYFLIIFILFFSIICVVWFAPGRFQQSGGPKVALVYLEGRLLEKVDLKNEEVTALLGGRMQLESKAGKIRVKQSDCPLHICLNTGWIRYSGESIICVPNKVLIEIKSTAAPLLDAVAN